MRDAFRLLRIPFSVYLMPVFWFAVSNLALIAPLQPCAYEAGNTVLRAAWVFALIHLLLYPASNGYNSYFDRDEGSIGGLKHPPRVTESLFWLVAAFDAAALLGALLLSLPFAGMMLVYMLVSKAYSWDKIRLKKYPLLSTVSVTFFQGAWTYAMVQVGITGAWDMQPFAFIATLLLLGSYPLTQVYQHEEDSRRGDRTLSLLLGTKGTFAFAAIALGAGAGWLVFAYFRAEILWRGLVFLVCTGPVLLTFGQWLLRARRDPAEINFENTMRMNRVSSLALSAAFLAMLGWAWFMK